jgi:hypothetical protein
MNVEDQEEANSSSWTVIHTPKRKDTPAKVIWMPWQKISCLITDVCNCSCKINAGTHTSHVVRAFLLRHHINTIAWPPYSPDLNPIEHLCWYLKKRVFGHYPQYNYYSVAAEEWEGFCDAFKECWRSIRGKLIKVLIISMPRRIYACRRAQGWQAKY